MKENELTIPNDDDPSQVVAPSEYAAYFLYGFGQCFSFGVVGSFILIFYTDIVGISSVIASAIFMIARLWDAVFDPVVSGWIDKHKTTTGKFRKYMRIAPIFVAVSTVTCFISPDISMGGKIMYAGVTYILWGTLYAFSDIPFWSLSTVISKNGQARTNLLTTANLGVFGGIGMVGLILPMMLTYFKQHGSPASSYMISVAILMVVGFVLMEIGYKFTKERVVSPKAEKLTTKDIVDSVKANKYMLRILLLFFLKIFMEMVNSVIIYFFTYNLLNANLMSVFGLIGTFSALGFFLIPLLTKRFKKLHILRVLLITDVIVRVIFFATGYRHVVPVFIFLAITQTLYSATGPIISAMLAETVEYSEVKTGKRCEAIVFGGQTFASKVAIAAAGALTGLLLSGVGYQANTTQSSTTLMGLFVIISILPALGSLLRLWVLAKYDYTEDEFHDCMKIIEERRLKAEADESSQA
ncbi:MFS transporter [Levilactobacillus tangyuanensis]|uniref:MFS transporter n=1 Tax=Levilactobacillus tangyuanensis TaxID=2486021 RepID=A0ABW1TRE5_9LACO|nr:glycoside-pentoside-hexuronide (GPH):cation symporter [Levilactobacillus tangyuanensis]